MRLSFMLAVLAMVCLSSDARTENQAKAQPPLAEEDMDLILQQVIESARRLEATLEALSITESNTQARLETLGIGLAWIGLCTGVIMLIHGLRPQTTKASLPCEVNMPACRLPGAYASGSCPRNRGEQ